MYVIFPADEIVYLSYGHLIYVPSTPQPDNELRSPPIRTSLDETQPSFPSTSGNSSISQSSDKEKSPPRKNWDRFDCIGSRSIDIEPRESLIRTRVNGFPCDERTVEGAQLVSRSDLINRSGGYKQPEPSKVPSKSAASGRPTKAESSKTLDQNQSRYTVDRYRGPNQSLKTKSQASTSTNTNSDTFKLFAAFNKPLKPGNSLESANLATVRTEIQNNRSGTSGRSLRTQKSLDIPTSTEFYDTTGNLGKIRPQNRLTTEFSSTTNRSTRTTNIEPEINSKSVEIVNPNTLGYTNRSIRAKNLSEIDNISSKNLESQDSGSLNRTKTASKILRTREEGSRTLERAYNSNSNKSSRSSKNSSGSSKSGTKSTVVPINRPRTVSDSVTNSKIEPKKKLSSNSFRSFLRSSVGKDKTPEPPVRPERKKTKKILESSDRISCSDYSTLNREKVARSDIVNTRSDQEHSFKSEKPVVKREKSPTIRFFRAQSSSPRTLGRDRTAFDFESFFKQDPAKLTVNSLGNTSDKTAFGSDTILSCPQSEKSPTKKRTFFNSIRASKKSPTSDNEAKMAGNESPLRDLIHPAYNEHLKSHNAVSFKLIRTVSDFTQQLGQMYERHAEELQMLVANFRKRNGELRKERPACPSSLFHTWETLLQEVEIDSQALGDIASILERQVSRPLLERSFHRKIQSRKVFSHRESYETIIAKTEEKLAKCRLEYKNAYLSYLSSPSTETLSAYFNTHNAYIQQLHATNGMMEEFGKNTVPSLLQELEEIYIDLCSTVTEAVLQGAEVVSSRATEQCRRYESLISQCRAVSGISDLSHLARSLPAPAGRGPFMRRIFVPPQPPPPTEAVEGDTQDFQTNDPIPPPLRDELVIDKLSAVQLKPSHDVLHKEALDLEAQVRQIQDAIDTILRIQQKSVEASLYNKANELQEDISMKRFDLRVAQIHLSAINSQKELFSNKLEGDSVSRERKMSSASTASMKNKWLKAFKSLKTPPPEAEKKNGAAVTRELLKGDPDAHNFQEYTYKKITPCDVCSQVLRGHTRQGLRCRICKMNIHTDCQDKASKCQTKARLLRRQKSTSEIETRVPELNPDEERVAEVFSMPTINRRVSMRTPNHSQQYPILNNAVVIEATEVDQIYQVLKQATEISNIKPRVNVEIITPTDKSISGSNPGSSGSSGQSLNRRAPPLQPSRASGSTLNVVNPAPCSTSSDHKQGPSMMNNMSVAESTSMRRRLFAGMKSLTGFGSRSRHGSPGHRSISLPEKRNSQDGSGNRPFGQPLYLGPRLENGNGLELPPATPTSPTPKGKISPVPKPRSKNKNK